MQAPILITGASTGIGYALTEALANKGQRVYATVRKSADADKLSRIENVFPLMMDVRNPDEIEAARRTVESEGLGLYGLVNNAGIGQLGPLHTFTEDEMQTIFDVNVFGPHRVTNAFLDLLLESKGRVVNIGSQGGSVSMKYFGPYTMTKHALEAYTIALDEELKSHGVRASIVQPGGIVTAIFDNMLDGDLKRFQRSKPPFEEEAAQVIHAMQNPSGYDPSQPESASNRNPSSPDIVTVAVLDALFSDSPKKRYMVGTRWEGNRVINMLQERLLDANDCPTMQYTRDELVNQLDEKWKLRE
jgi:NAD(P)-dependent dehydrogenase (short-subunit alcohol dehydrogenase family)